MSNGPFLLGVNMNSPAKPSRHFMDSLLAFWPGLQVRLLIELIFLICLITTLYMYTVAAAGLIFLPPFFRFCGETLTLLYPFTIFYTIL